MASTVHGIVSSGTSAMRSSSASMSGAKRRASEYVATVTSPSSSAAAMAYWNENLPSSPLFGRGRST
jgi:hypothetical protein